MFEMFLAYLLKLAMMGFSKIITGARAVWDDAGAHECNPPKPCVYFANHRSHGDFALLWTVLPLSLRTHTRPVAGAEYWRATWLRRLIATKVLNAVLIERDPAARGGDQDAPIAQMRAALAQGDSLILFPEGTRNLTDEPLLALKSGLFHLAHAAPGLQLIPAWIDNLHRVMPKGELIPLPLLCTVRFGAPLTLDASEDKAQFLCRARDAMLDLGARK
jgi:1-acyl-sn-glycerol-3-phosphate acyltransferase